MKYSDERDSGEYRPEYDRSSSSKHYPIESGRYRADEPGMENFTSLRLSNINPKVPDDEVRENVYHSYRKFGEFNIKFAHTVDRRLVYVNFSRPDDAIAAKESTTDRLELFGRLICVEPVNHNRQWNNRPPGNGRGDGYQYRSGSPYSAGGHHISSSGSDMWDYQKRDARFPDHYFQQRAEGENRQFVDMKHMQPEDDRRACRTLFVANVDEKMDPGELKKFFEPYGIVEDIDVKLPTRTGNPYAFVRFFNLDMAFEAKLELSGQMLGRYQCKIGYARPVPTTCVWVGGLGSWVRKQELLHEFDRFGKVIRMEWPKGHTYAYIAYDNVEASKAAIIEMRGFMFRGATKGIRTDFAELRQMDMPQPVFKKPSRRASRRSLKTHSRSMSSEEERRVLAANLGPKRKYGRGSRSNSSSSGDNKSPFRSQKKKKRSASSSGSNTDFSDSDSQGRSDKKRTVFQIGNVDAAETILDLARCLPVVWSGALELKNSTFFTRMHLVSGDVSLVDSLLGVISPTEHLKINQRLRLDRSKLKEVERRINLSGPNGWCVLVAVSDLSDNTKEPSNYRPLMNLVSYLNAKNAAGVMSLPPDSKHGHETGLLHTFPPCEFAHRYLLKCAPRLVPNFMKEDHIVVFLVRVNV